MIKVIDSNNINTTNNVGTHNGIFHSDEVVATAIIDILTGINNTTNVIRSRDLDLLNKNAEFMILVVENLIIIKKVETVQE